MSRAPRPMRVLEVPQVDCGGISSVTATSKPGSHAWLDNNCPIAHSKPNLHYTFIFWWTSCWNAIKCSVCVSYTSSVLLLATTGFIHTGKPNKKVRHAFNLAVVPKRPGAGTKTLFKNHFGKLT